MEGKLGNVMEKNYHFMALRISLIRPNYSRDGVTKR
jgi:hypothetical protein